MKELSYKLFFKAFSNKTRFKIIQLLRKGPRNVTEICRQLRFEQSRVSHNLRCLMRCGFVENRKDGRQVIYSLNKRTIKPLLGLIDRHIIKYSAHLKRCGILKEK